MVYFSGIYIAETSHPNVRANLVSLFLPFYSLGMLFVWVLGYYLSWRNTAYVSMIPSILLLILIIPLPETPYWLVQKNKNDLAK